MCIIRGISYNIQCTSHSVRRTQYLVLYMCTLRQITANYCKISCIGYDVYSYRSMYIIHFKISCFATARISCRTYILWRTFNVRRTMYYMHLTVYSVHRTLYTVCIECCIIQRITIYTVYCYCTTTLYNDYYIMSATHCTLYKSIQYTV